jgi:Ca-activated chloride channel family protein
MKNDKNLAEKRALVLFSLALVVPFAHASPNWRDLWTTPDQQGTQLMQQGKAQEAARTFADPRHKAYAELASGAYTDAARDYTSFVDSDSQYNRGNALAHTGDLAGAIKAYDAALARDPQNRDARHNRDLVAEAMRQQPPQPQSGEKDKNDSKTPSHGKDDAQDKPSSGQDKAGAGAKDKPSSGQGKSKPDAGQSGQAATSQSGTGKQPNPIESPGSGQTGSGKPGQQQDSAKAGAKSGAQTQDGQSKQQAGNDAGNPANGAAQSPGADPKTGQPTARTEAQTGDEKTQAERDETAGVDSLRPSAGAKPENKESRGVGETIGAEEKRLAQEQWLRNIPDDPGGLLRRKLLIEHMIRQQKAQP